MSWVWVLPLGSEIIAYTDEYGDRRLIKRRVQNINFTKSIRDWEANADMHGSRIRFWNPRKKGGS